MARAWGTAVPVLLLLAGGLTAQEERFPGVRLGLVYEETYQPALALETFTGRFGGGAVASRVETIVGRDLRHSDRFTLMDSVPAALMGGGETVDYALWDDLGAVWLLGGSVEGAGDGEYVVVLRLHDVVYGQIKEEGRFRIPGPEDPDFRMAVHRISDQVVEWVFGEPGMAASRIAFSMTQDGGKTKEIWVIDSDGENLRRVTDHQSLSLSPTWAPDGERLAYLSYRDVGNGDTQPAIYEKNFTTGEGRKIRIVREGMPITPTYHPDGETLAFAVQGGTRGGLYTYNLARECCLRNLTAGPWNDLSPAFSPDGEWIAFNSNRFGDAVPQIFVMPADGGEADPISPYRFGEQGYYTSPDWSPFGDFVAFHGKIGRTGRYHILVARMSDEGSRLLQLTDEGNNEDPSWAPDGRHLVFIGERSWGKGLFVVDTATGTIRTLLGGVSVGVPEWSPSLDGG